MNSPKRYSSPALAHTMLIRNKGQESAYWWDVSAAYDAGMKHALENKASAKRALEALRQPVPQDAGK